MQEAGFIDGLQRAEAEATPLALKPAEPKYWISQAPWFSSWVQQELPGVLSKEQLEVGGLTVRSTLNLTWQQQAQTTINQYAPGQMEGALVAMEPGTGVVRAMVGGKDFDKSQFNRAAQALRSPGSTFKLFVYLSALKAGMLPERTVVDRPQCFKGYCPRNFGGRYLGRVSLAVALQNSLNTVAVSLLRELGFDRVIETAKSLGITRELGRFYPMAIGAYEQTLLDMTAAYAAITNRGIFVRPTPFEEILGPDGQLLWSRRVDGDQGRRAVPSDIADTMLWMLQQVVNGGTGGGAALADRPVAGKTGTSEGGRDLWFIGSIPQLTTGVWLGYDDSRETRSTSVVATLAWRSFMAPISKTLPVRQFPPKPQLQNSYNPEARKAKPAGTADLGNRNASSAWTPGTPAVPALPERYVPVPEGTPSNVPPTGPGATPSTPATAPAAPPTSQLAPVAVPPPPVAAPPAP
jgi:penicillin-binding protein 1A